MDNEFDLLLIGKLQGKNENNDRIKDVDENGINQSKKKSIINLDKS